MSVTSTSRFRRPNAGSVATVTVVVVAFVVTWVAYLAERNSAGGPPYSGVALSIATMLGVLYLILILYGYPILRPIAGRHTTSITIALLLFLLLAIEFLLGGSSGIWLISMPLIATAATDLPPGPRVIVYVATIAGVILPSYLRYENWEFTFFNTLTFITAFVFVIALIRLTQAAEQAQLRAEKLAAELADANRRLGEYAIQAEELATTQERNRLAREIHDNLGHYLTIVNVQINAARALLDKDPVRADAALQKAGQLTQEGLTAIRQSVSALRESPLGRRSLSDAIAKLTAEMQSAGIIAELHVNGPIRRLDTRTELTFYRAAQESLTNVRKHARASRVDLTLDYGEPASVSLTVSDNGVGNIDKENNQPGFGLLGLQERARQLGGHIAVRSAPGEGYCLIVQLPTTTVDPIAMEEGSAE